MLAAFLGGWLANPALADEPSPAGPVPNKLPVAVSPNQQLADTIAGTLRQSVTLKGYTVEISVVGSSVELSGTVASQPQKEEVLRLVQGVPGVERVVDHLRPIDPLVKVQVLQPQPGFGQPFPGTFVGGNPGLPIPGTLPAPGQPFPSGPLETTFPGQPLPGQPLPQPREFGGTNPGQPGNPPVLPQPLPGGITGEPPLSGPFPGGPGMTGPGGRPEPVPIYSAPGLGFETLNPPRMPPYSWPTYAPYNNYSRVAYPEAYPYNAWPFIGPVHPFPKIPLGWRSVRLTWDDGYWWFARTATRYDWWKLRFY
jgi:hypothetical protein